MTDASQWMDELSNANYGPDFSKSLSSTAKKRLNLLRNKYLTDWKTVQATEADRATIFPEWNNMTRNEAWMERIANHFPEDIYLHFDHLIHFPGGNYLENQFKDEKEGLKNLLKDYYVLVDELKWINVNSHKKNSKVTIEIVEKKKKSTAAMRKGFQHHPVIIDGRNTNGKNLGIYENLTELVQSNIGELERIKEIVGSKPETKKRKANGPESKNKKQKTQLKIRCRLCGDKAEYVDPELRVPLCNIECQKTYRFIYQ